MNTQAASPGCPDPETISAVFDGEHEPDDALRAHLNECPDCARRLADYAAMRDHVSRIIASEPDDGFNARIASFVRAEAAALEPVLMRRDNEFRDSRSAWILRIAALLMLSGLFVYLLMDRIHENRAGSAGRHSVAASPAVPSAGSAASNPVSVSGGDRMIPTMFADPRAGSFVKASLVSDTPSVQQYKIDIDPALIPDELEDIPEDERIPVPVFFGTDGDTMHRIPLRGNPASDAMRMLESIRRDLIALDVEVPVLSVDTESRGNSLFTTIRLESAGKLDMSMRKTDDMFEFFLMSAESSGDSGPVSFQIEFFCE